MSIDKSSSNSLYPVFLKLNRLKLLIVGAGNVGYEKLYFILKSSPDAVITVIAENISNPVKRLVEDFPNVQLIKKSFEQSDLQNKDLVIAATGNSPVNDYIQYSAKQAGILINVADTPDLCDFYLGSIVTKGDLKIAISTNGKSPTFAKRFRQMLEDILPDSIPDLLKNLKSIRDELKGDFESKVNKLNDLTAILIDKKVKQEN